MLKKILTVLASILIAFVLVIVGLLTFVMLGKDTTLNQQIGDINLEGVADGTYAGSYSGFRWSNTVEVTVKDHQITDIKVVKPQMFARETTYTEITDRVKKQQNLKVDAVAEASVDTKAFLKAVENAVNGQK